MRARPRRRRQAMFRMLVAFASLAVVACVYIRVNLFVLPPSTLESSLSDTLENEEMRLVLRIAVWEDPVLSIVAFASIQSIQEHSVINPIPILMDIPLPVSRKMTIDA